MVTFYQWLCSIDQAVAVLLIALACWIVVSGLDDLVLNVVFVLQCFRERRFPTPAELSSAEERPIAIFVPAWHEHRVIGKMLEHNASSVRYSNYHFFVGAYPNDSATVGVVREIEQRLPNVHLAITPHDGPSSKADCLNWIYRRVLEYEAATGMNFEIVVTHDSEDIIHPEALRWINYLSRSYDMVQIPVIPLPTPVWRWTHGIYCDEFTECHTRDMRARQFFGAFIPSCGVGTGFTREIVNKLALHANNRIFEPACLTEDYENGLRLHKLGARQIFVPILKREGSFVTTREYFPQTVRAAIKQRTRWITGIALQTWERYGWQGDAIQKYWLWRDRKGLIGNPVGLLTTVVSLYGAFSYGASCAMQSSWTLGDATLPMRWLFGLTLMLGLMQLGVRMICVARCYGLLFALFVPVRVVLANFINSVATLFALARYAEARTRREPLVWVKTDHSYPAQGSLTGRKRKLEEVLVGGFYLTEGQWEAAQATKPPPIRIERHLVRAGYLTEDELCEALSLQQQMSCGSICPNDVRPSVARSLPADVVRHWRVLPYKVEAGHLHLAGPEPPTEELQRELSRYTTLEVRFHLVTASNFAELASRLL